MKYQIPTLLLAALVVAGHPLQANANGFTPPSWSSEANALYSEWLDFTSAHGEPGNSPDVDGSNAGGVLTQSVPGATVTGSGNIYNPAGASAFMIQNTATAPFLQVSLQARIIGEIDPDSVLLGYQSEGETKTIATDTIELSRETGAFGDTVVYQWTWDLTDEEITDMTLQYNAAAAHASLAAVRLDTLVESGPKPLAFVAPDWASDTNARYSEWLNFTTAFGEPGNSPDVDGSTASGVLTQSVPGATVTGSGNIYNPAAASAFALTNQSETHYKSVILQTKIIGGINPESVQLNYEKNGETISQTSAGSEIARESGGFGDTVINQWVWDLSEAAASSFTIHFGATAPHASLAAVRIDTLSTTPPQPLEFVAPTWTSSANADSSEWLQFTTAFGEPGNAPDIAGAEGDAVLRQVVPGAVVTGSGNIYNPAGASLFQVTDEADTTYRSIVLQTKITGSIDPESVFLDYEHNGGTQSLAAQGEELAVKPGAFGSTVVNRWTWDVATLNISKFTLRLQATGAHASLVGARLDTLTAPTSSGELVELLFEEPSNDRWNYPFNATPGTRARASLFRSADPEVGVSRHGTLILGFQTDDHVPTGRAPEAYEIVSAQLRLLTSDNFEVPHDPTYDSVLTHLPETNDQHVADEDPGRPIHVFGAGFRNDFERATWNETAAFAPEGSFIPSVYPAVFDESGALVDVSLAVDYANPKEMAPFSTGTLPEIPAGELIPEDTWMHFELDLSHSTTVAYLQSGLSQGNLSFTVTSLNQGGREVRSFPEFHTSDSLLGEAPQLELSVRLIDPPSATTPEIQGIQLTQAGVRVSFGPVSSGTIGIRWTSDFVQWHTVDNPNIEQAQDGSGHWIDTDASASARFYQITLTP